LSRAINQSGFDGKLPAVWQTRSFGSSDYRARSKRWLMVAADFDDAATRLVVGIHASFRAAIPTRDAVCVVAVFR
jgi:hypothetical protein